MKHLLALAALLATTVPSAVHAMQNAADAGLPEGVRAMIESAIASGDTKTTEAVIRLARETDAFAGAEIDQISERWRLRLTEAEANKKLEQRRALQEADLFDHWRGTLTSW